MTLSHLDLALATGVRLTGLTIGPPRGFRQDVLTAGSIRVEYALSSLLRGVLRARQVELTDVTLVLEANAGGSNLDALLAALVDDTVPASARPEPIACAPPPRPSAPTLPSLPLPVEVDHLRVGPVALRIRRPDLRLALEPAFVEGSFSGQRSHYDLRVRAGVGLPGTPSELALEQPERVELSSQLILRLDVAFRGFEDLELAAEITGTSEMTRPLLVPATAARLALAARANLVEERAEVLEGSLQVGRATLLEGLVELRELFGPVLIEVPRLALAVDLDEVEPLLRPLLRELDLEGTLEAQLLRAEGLVAKDRPNLDLAVALDGRDLRISSGPHRIEEARLFLDARLKEGSLSTVGELDVGEARAGAFSVETASVEIESVIPLEEPPLARREEGPAGPAPLRAGSSLRRDKRSTARAPRSPTDASVPLPRARDELRAQVRLASLTGPALEARRVFSDLRLLGLVEALRRRGDRPAVTFTLEPRIAQLRSGGVTLRGIRAEARGALDGLDIGGVTAQVDARADQVVSALSDGRALVLPPVSVEGEIVRRGARLMVPKLAARIGEVLELSGKLDADGLGGAAPRLRQSQLELAVPGLEKALALLPADVTPPGALSGGIRVDLELDGVVPTEVDASLPRLGGPPDQALRALGVALERLALRFEEGLGLSLRLALEGRALGYRGPDAHLEDLSVDVALDLLERGPSLDVDAHAGLLRLPGAALLTDLDLFTNLGFDGRSMASRIFARLGGSKGPGIPNGLGGSSLEARLSYEVGGALVVEHLDALVPEHEAFLRLRLLFEDPLRAVRERSALRRGMPGLSVAAHVESGVRFGQVTGRMLLPGTELEGKLGLELDARIEEGTLEIAGMARADEISMTSSTARWIGLVGDVPFELALATWDRDGFTSLPHQVPFGDGRLRLRAQPDEATETSGLPYRNRLRNYRADRGVQIEELLIRGFSLRHIALDGRVEHGSIVAERARLSLLGGDIEGAFSLGLRGEGAVGGHLDLELSNVDASYFPALDLEPGPESEIDGHASLDLQLTPQRRDLTASMNVTRISTRALDRFLQLLDPEQQNESLQRTRSWLSFAQIDGVALWLAYENLNMDLDATSILKIPYTSIGFPSFDRELLRREPMGERLDVYLDPLLRKALGPLIDLRRNRRARTEEPARGRARESPRTSSGESTSR